MKKAAKIFTALVLVSYTSLFLWNRHQMALAHERWIAASVECPKCTQRFLPEANKATLGGSIAAGTVAGAATGGVGGAYAGAGTGVAVGGVGAFPGAVVFGGIGAFGGGFVGGLSGALYADGRVECPHCNKVFKNPKN